MELCSAVLKQRSEIKVEGNKTIENKIQIIPLNLDLDLLFRISEYFKSGKCLIIVKPASCTAFVLQANLLKLTRTPAALQLPKNTAFFALRHLI